MMNGHVRQHPTHRSRRELGARLGCLAQILEPHASVLLATVAAHADVQDCRTQPVELVRQAPNHLVPHLSQAQQRRDHRPHQQHNRQHYPIRQFAPRRLIRSSPILSWRVTHSGPGGHRTYEACQGSSQERHEISITRDINDDKATARRSQPTATTPPNCEESPEPTTLSRHWSKHSGQQIGDR